MHATCLCGALSPASDVAHPGAPERGRSLVSRPCPRDEASCRSRKPRLNKNLPLYLKHRRPTRWKLVVDARFMVLACTNRWGLWGHREMRVWGVLSSSVRGLRFEVLCYCIHTGGPDLWGLWFSRDGFVPGQAAPSISPSPDLRNL